MFKWNLQFFAQIILVKCIEKLNGQQYDIREDFFLNKKSNLLIVIHSNRTTTKCKSLPFGYLWTKFRMPWNWWTCCMLMCIWNAWSTTKLPPWMRNSSRMSFKSCLYCSTMSRSLHWLMWIQRKMYNTKSSTNMLLHRRLWRWSIC